MYLHNFTGLKVMVSEPRPKIKIWFQVFGTRELLLVYYKQKN